MGADKEYSSESDIRATLSEIDDALEYDRTVYLLGGGAMALEQVKPTTKDIDLLAPTEQDYQRTREALLDLGFEPKEHTEPDYDSLGAATVLKYGDGHVDLFDRQVMSKLSLSQGMEERAVEIFSAETLTVHRLSWTDVTLFKSMTPRDDDLNDVRDLMARGIDFEVLATEIDEQLPLNYGIDEYEWVINNDLQHPIFQLEESFTSIQGFPDELVTKVRRLADIVDAEREIFYELRDRGKVERKEFISEFASQANATAEQLNDGINRLEQKNLISRDGEQIELEPPEIQF